MLAPSIFSCLFQRTNFRLNIRLITFVDSRLTLSLTQIEKVAHLLQVVGHHDGVVNQVTFLLLRLLRQDVTVISMMSFHFTRSGKNESFFGTGISFLFWHFVCFLICYLICGNAYTRRYAHASLVSPRLPHAALGTLSGRWLWAGFFRAFAPGTLPVFRLPVSWAAHSSSAR